MKYLKNNISKINNFFELSENLLKDLENLDKKTDQSSTQIKSLEQKTLKDTMTLVTLY